MIKLLPMSIGAIALSVITQLPAHAALVGGQVTGTWYGSSGGAYTADYTYDDSTVTTTDTSIPGLWTEISTEVSLLSLVLNSSNITPNSYAFNLSNNPAKLRSRVYDSSPSGVKNTDRRFSIYAADANYELTPSSEISTDSNGVPSAYSIAFLYQKDPVNQSVQLVGAGTAAFSNTAPVPVPTPMLLPGLISFGVSLVRKTKQEKAIASSI
jgi:hypothetical protein